jgi:hypothetical protein
MPQAQILDAPEAFGSQLGKQLGEGLGSGLQQTLARYQKEKQFESAGFPKEFAHFDPSFLNKILELQQQQNLQNIMDTSDDTENYNDSGSFEDLDENNEDEFNYEIEDDSRVIPKPKQSGAKSSKNYSPKQIRQIGIYNPQLARLLQSQTKEENKKQQKLEDRNLSLFDDANKTLKVLDEQDLDLSQLKNLSKEIQLSEKGNESFSKRFGKTFRFDPETRSFTRIGRATSTPAEERYVKLISNLTRNIKDDYGARITNLDLSIFLQRFPDLMMTSKGREEILDTIIDYNKAKNWFKKV